MTTSRHEVLPISAHGSWDETCLDQFVDRGPMTSGRGGGATILLPTPRSLCSHIIRAHQLPWPEAPSSILLPTVFALHCSARPMPPRARTSDSAAELPPFDSTFASGSSM